MQVISILITAFLSILFGVKITLKYCNLIMEKANKEYLKELELMLAEKVRLARMARLQADYLQEVTELLRSYSMSTPRIEKLNEIADKINNLKFKIYDNEKEQQA